MIFAVCFPQTYKYILTLWLTIANLPSIRASQLIYIAQCRNCAFFRKGGARTHNLSLFEKCFTQRQLGRMLFLKLLFLLLAASTGIEPVKWRIQSPLPYPLGYKAICWFGYSRPITPSGHASSEGLYISSIVVLLLVLWVLDGDTCYLDIRQTKLSPFNLNIFFVSKRTMFLVFLQFQVKQHPSDR